jgi:DUF1680 family protein
MPTDVILITRWRDGRVAEGARLESVFTLTGNLGSNPSLSAITFYHPSHIQFLVTDGLKAEPYPRGQRLLSRLKRWTNMSPMSELSRRRLLSSTALAAGALMIPERLLCLPQDPVLDRPRNKTGKRHERVPWKVEPFPMGQVKLRTGPLRDAMEINRRYLVSIPNDRLLHTFRITAGIPSNAEPLGGWEAPDCELRGHFAGGHYLSACALMYASSQDEELRTKANSLVAELAKCQQPSGYLSAYPVVFFDRLQKHEKVWAPFYTYHKIMAGHLDMYVHCGNEQALTTAERMATWSNAWAQPIPEEQFQQILLVEYGGMAETLFNLYAITGKPEYVTLARRFSHKKFFDPLASDQDDLPGIHANTHIPQVIGAARGYELTGDAQYHEVASYFWREVATEHTYATGGTSNSEFWQEPGKLAKQLGPSAEECCCSYNMMKLTRHIFGWTADPRAMDYYERMLFNVRLGTQDPNGMLMYYVPLKPGMWKTFGTSFGSFWCCTGTGVEEYAKTNDTIYFHDNQNLFINLFVGSELNWPQKELRLIQDTNFPEEEGTTMTLHVKKPISLALQIRIPYWATNGVQVKLNGILQHVTTMPGSYLELTRKWHDGDRLEVSLPMSLHSAPLPDDETLQAAMYGPLVLAAQMGKEGLTKEMIYGDSEPDAKKQKAVPMPEVIGTSNPTSWIAKVSGQPLGFQTVGQSEATRLIPLYKLLDGRYSVYWKVHPKSV